ncbi:hypothetical protein CRUP_003896, partial [Coryphaenoides rupestris]
MACITSTPLGSQVALKPGHSLMDWIRFAKSGRDLTGLRGHLLDVTEEELKKHSRRDDCWTCIRGLVYNVTPYMDFHPGGEEELMRAAGTDGTELFDQLKDLQSTKDTLAVCRIREETLQNQLTKLLEDLREAREAHTPELRQLQSLQASIHSMELRHTQRESQLTQLIGQARQVVEAERQEEVERWKRLAQGRSKEVHRWVNYESMLKECLVGRMATKPTAVSLPQDVQDGVQLHTERLHLLAPPLGQTLPSLHLLLPLRLHHLPRLANQLPGGREFRSMLWMLAWRLCSCLSSGVWASLASRRSSSSLRPLVAGPYLLGAEGVGQPGHPGGGVVPGVAVPQTAQRPATSSWASARALSGPRASCCLCSSSSLRSLALSAWFSSSTSVMWLPAKASGRRSTVRVSSCAARVLAASSWVSRSMRCPKAASLRAWHLHSHELINRQAGLRLRYA